MGEHCVRIAGVRGSNPLASTTSRRARGKTTIGPQMAAVLESRPASSPSDDVLLQHVGLAHARTRAAIGGGRASVLHC